MNTLSLLKQALNERELQFFSPLAARSENGLRKKAEERSETDYRQNFAVDVDRILHSLAYTRYIDKTQVFYLVSNDHITHRVLHVQLVSKVARTIGRFLGLNEDLIEAIALGHDIGHPPFGHEGESILSDICRMNGIGHFHHNVQSVRYLDAIERKGTGWNLCLQTLDGILCHDGETHSRTLTPHWEKDFAALEKDMQTRTLDDRNGVYPMTLEGCVVRMADTISYIGRDIEDAIRLGLIQRTDLPVKSVSLLGSTNGQIVFNLVTDLIENSYQETYLAFSESVADALKTLKQFNYERIYLNPKIKLHADAVKRLYEHLFHACLNHLEKDERAAPIYSQFLNDMSDNYLSENSNAEIARDFIAGMTDRYFLAQCPENMKSEIHPIVLP